ncbi:hypothetical protein MTY66_49150 [Mycolicibacterium sp. TY66]|nr:hypothetical protein MTY66_49150 [Mycolicibacterium sp. TY66]BCJ79067.1 hypothetical protein MTY81_04400 [Mycolicibacterium sp. TY81]
MSAIVAVKEKSIRDRFWAGRQHQPTRALRAKRIAVSGYGARSSPELNYSQWLWRNVRYNAVHTSTITVSTAK